MCKDMYIYNLIHVCMYVYTHMNLYTHVFITICVPLRTELFGLQYN